MTASSRSPNPSRARRWRGSRRRVLDPLPAPDGNRRPTEVGSGHKVQRPSHREGLAAFGKTRHTFVRPLISSAEIQGTVLMFTWIGDEGAATFSCSGRGSPESVADAADSLNAVGNCAQFPAEAANHDVDR